MSKRWAVKPTAERILDEARQRAQSLSAAGTHPHLAVVLAGDDPASGVYVRNKIRTCEALGIRSTLKAMPDSTTTAELLSVVNQLNEDPAIHGILVQLPLPAGVEEAPILRAIDPRKDVDGFHAVNAGRLSQGKDGLFPCTPMGIIELLKDTGVHWSGAHAAVVGRSNIVGKPMAMLLLRLNFTVSILHSRTKDPQDLCRNADLVVAAVGRPGLVDASWLKQGAYVVDVGMNQVTDAAVAARLFAPGSKKLASFEQKGRVLCGDVFYRDALNQAQLVTPVPGGVGKLTIAHLMMNCVKAAAGDFQE